MKVLITTLILTLATFVPTDKALKIILNDCQFPKLPKAAKIIGHEVVTAKNKRYGYVAFESPSTDLLNWIEQSNLKQTSKEEIFNKDLIVLPAKRPTWFEKSSNQFTTADIYYSKREPDSFLTLCWVDVDRKVIHAEYEIGR